MLKKLRTENPDLIFFKPGDEEFRRYGRPVPDPGWGKLIEQTAGEISPEAEPAYIASCPELELSREYEKLMAPIFGKEDVQIGVCRGYNDRLNGMEWHDCPEVVAACTDMVLLLGRREDMADGHWDSGLARACFLKAGEAVELFAGTLHFAPIRVGGQPFLSVIVLPRGVNGDLEEGSRDEAPLWKVRKWLIAHPESPQKAAGAAAGIRGGNIVIRIPD